MAGFFRKLVPEIRRIDGVRYRVLQGRSVSAGVRALQVDELEDKSVSSLDFLEPARESLTHLIVTNLWIEDVSVLDRLDRLQSLTLHAGRIRQGVDGALPVLEELFVDWSERIAPLLSSPRLRDIAIISPAPELPIAGRSLDLLMLKNVKQVRLPALQVPTLVIAGGRRRGEVAGLVNVAGLRDLTLDSVVPTDLPDTPAAAFSGLKRLVLENCGSISSLAAFADAELDELIVVGKLSVGDGSFDRLKARRRHIPPGAG